MSLFSRMLANEKNYFNTLRDIYTTLSLRLSRTLTVGFKMAASAERKPECVVPPEESDLLRIAPV